MLALTTTAKSLVVYDSDTGKIYDYLKSSNKFKEIVGKLMLSQKSFVVYDIYKLMKFIEVSDVSTMIAFSKRTIDIALLSRNARNKGTLKSKTFNTIVSEIAFESMAFVNESYQLYCIYVALCKQGDGVMLPVDVVEIAQAACQYKMISNGLHIDEELRDSIKVSHEEEIKDISDELDVFGIRDRDGVDNIVKVIESRTDLKLKGKLPTVSECRINKNIPWFVLVYHHRNKLREEISDFLSLEGVCHSTISVYSKFSGRSSSKPNIHGFPNTGSIRNIIVPSKKSKIFLSADYSYAGMIAFAQTCLTKYGVSKLAEDINLGISPHDSMMEYLAKALPDVKVTRKLAKLVNFAFPTGMSGTTIVKYAAKMGVVITVAEGKKLYEKWIDSCPSIRSYMDSNGSVVSINGRCLTGTKNEVRSFLFQSVVSDCVNLAMVLLSQAGFRIVNHINDEFLIEVDVLDASESAKQVDAIMVKAFAVYCPDIPVSVDSALSDNWDKSAEAVYNKAGNLVKWGAEDDGPDMVWAQLFSSAVLIERSDAVASSIIFDATEGESVLDLSNPDSRISKKLKSLIANTSR